MGRPAKIIDKAEFEKLCQLQCTIDEICGWFDVDEKVLNKWCRKIYGETFRDVFNKKKGVGRISLRRAQYQLAKKNAAMAIFLGKNYLGQTDTPPQQTNVVLDDSLIKALRATGSEVWDDDTEKERS